MSINYRGQGLEGLRGPVSGVGVAIQGGLILSATTSVGLEVACDDEAGAYALWTFKIAISGQLRAAKHR